MWYLCCTLTHISGQQWNTRLIKALCQFHGEGNKFEKFIRIGKTRCRTENRRLETFNPEELELNSGWTYLRSNMTWKTSQRTKRPSRVPSGPGFSSNRRAQSNPCRCKLCSAPHQADPVYVMIEAQDELAQLRLGDWTF